MKVSVITTTKNSKKYLESCILSVLNQTYTDVEHVFVDCLSTDGTLDILEKYSSEYPNRIRYISEIDKGTCDAWNKGIRLATGDILGWLGSDDTYCPNAIEDVIEAFSYHPLTAGVMFGDTNMMDETGKILSTVYGEDFDLQKSITTACCMYTTSTFIHRKVIDRVGLLDPSIHVCDFDLYLRAGKEFSFYRINKVLSNFRVHSNSVTGAKDSLYMYAKENYMVAKRYGATLMTPRGRNYILMSLTHPFHPMIVSLYHSRLFSRILPSVYHLIVGHQGREKKV